MSVAPMHPPEGSVPCPLCESADTRQFDTILVADLRAEYLRQFGVDTEPEFDPTLKSLALLGCGKCGLEFFHPAVSGSPDFYARLSQAQTYYSVTRWEFAQAAKLIGPEARIVDVGCGDGHFLSLLPQKTKLGLELNADAAARAAAKGLTVRTETLEALPDGSADVVTMFQVLEHMPMPRRILCEAVRVLRPGGLLLLAVPNNDGFIGLAIFEPLNFPPHHPLRWTAAALRYLPGLYPLELERLAEEPLASEHVFIHRRTRLTQLFARRLRRRLPLMKCSAPLVLLRKIANALTLASMRIHSKPPRNPAIGHSYLAVYRKKTP